VTETRNPADGRVRLLVGGVVLIAGLLIIAMVAATEPWLPPLASVALLAVGLSALRRGVPRLFIAITLGFAVVLAGVTVLQWAPEEAPAVAEAAPVMIAGPTLLSGTVTEAGTPLADVPLQVTLWPSNEDTEVGELVDTRDLPAVTTDEQGRYVVTLALEDVPAKYLLSGRVLNFNVAVTDPFMAAISASARYPRGGHDWVDVFGDKNSEPTTLDFDLGSMKATETADGESQTWDLVQLHPAPALE
jgi:hypothetical protein